MLSNSYTKFCFISKSSPFSGTLSLVALVSIVGISPPILGSALVLVVQECVKTSPAAVRGDTRKGDEPILRSR